MRLTLLWSCAVLIALAKPSWAVVPGLAGPLQAIGQILPQILPFLVAGLAGMFSIPAWRARLQRLGQWIVTPRGALLCCAGVAVLSAGAAGLRAAEKSRAAIAAPGAPAVVGADWTMFRGNLSRTGAAPSAAGPAKASVLWSYQDPQARVADLSSSPAVVGDRIFIGSAQASVFDSTGMLYCIDAKSGHRIWQYPTEKQVFSSPAVVGGKVYVGEGLHVDTGCNVYCIDAATGKRLWTRRTKSHTESSPAVVGGKVYVGAGDDGVYCLNAATGKPVWHFPGWHVDVSPAVAEGKVFIGSGYGKTGALALDAATGKPVWTTACDLPVWGPPAVVGGRVYYGVGNGDFVKSSASPKGGVWCLEAASGHQVWRRDLPDAALTAVLVQNGQAVAGCRDGKVYALDAASGVVRWNAPCGGPVVASAASDGKSLFVAGGNGVTALDSAGKPQWSVDLATKTGPDVKLFSSPAVANGRIYLGTSKEKLFCIGQ